MGGIPGDALLLLIPMLSSMPGEYVKSTSSHRQAAFGIDDGGEVQPPPAPTARTGIHVNVNNTSFPPPTRQFGTERLGPVWGQTLPVRYSRSKVC
jgi:hypothetical protein